MPTVLPADQNLNRPFQSARRSPSDAARHIRLAPDLASGTIQNTITNPDFDAPTTVALFGDATYVVNARFGTPSAGTIDFAVVRTERNG